MTTDLTEGRELLEAGRASNMWRSKDRDAWRAWLVRNGYALLDLAERTQAAEARCAELEAELRLTEELSRIKAHKARIARRE
jgi:hypothetical protein